MVSVILLEQAAKNNQTEIFLAQLTCHLFYNDEKSQVAFDVQQVPFRKDRTRFVFVAPAFDAIHTVL